MDTVTIPSYKHMYLDKTTGDLKVVCKNSGLVSDDYHTFDSLYNQRMILSAALAKLSPDSWKSMFHNDGSSPFGGGWFIMGWDTPRGSYTYHYKLQDWDKFECKIIERAPKWDGHTDKDIKRLLSLGE